MDDNCRNLWAAVLERAIEDAVRGGNYWIDRENAKTWFLSDDRDVGSFLWVCDIVNLDPSVLRAFVLGKSDTDKNLPHPGQKWSLPAGNLAGSDRKTGPAGTARF
jgi:hypothetical protein